MNTSNNNHKTSKVGRPFQILLIAFFLAITTYTYLAVKNEGWNLFVIFFDNMMAFNWSGQFNLDFSSYLILSGLWIGWRYNFSAKGIILCIIASVLGILFFAPYLLVISVKENGDWKAIFLGERAS